MSRFIPRYLTLKQWGLLKGLIVKGDMLLLPVVITFALLLFGLGEVGVFEEQVSRGLVLAAVLVPTLSFLTLRKSQLAAQKKAAKGLFLNEFVPPTAIVFVSFFITFSDANTSFYIFAGFNFVAVVLATVVTYKSWSPEFYRAKVESDFKKWMLIALPLVAAVSGKMIMSKADIIMLAPLSNVEQVGYYGAMFRVTYLLTFAQVVLMTVMSPLLSEAITKKDFAIISRRFFVTLGAAFIFAIPLAVFILVFRLPIVEFVFGSEYVASTSVLTILVFAQTAVTLNMPFTSLIIMSGREKAYGVVVMLALVLNLLLNWHFIPLDGALGASKATLAANFFSLACGLFLCVSVMKTLKAECESR